MKTAINLVFPDNNAKLLKAREMSVGDIGIVVRSRGHFDENTVVLKTATGLVSLTNPVDTWAVDLIGLSFDIKVYSRATITLEE